MIYLHKIIPLFLLPTGITLLLVVSGMILRRRALCWAGIILLWLSSTALVSKKIMRAAEGWQTRKPVAAMAVADAIVVLSTGRTQPPGAPDVSEWADADRFYGGIELYKANKAPLLVFTGGWVPWKPTAKPEGEVLMQYAAELGVPASRMMTTSKVTNTDEESRAVADVLKERLGSQRLRVLLVTSAFHMHRAQMLFTRAGIEVLPFPVDFQVSDGGSELGVLDFLPNGGSLGQTEVALRELYGFVFYRFLRD